MPEWAAHLRPRLSSLRLSPAREHEIVEELSQHLEDRWRELVAGGASEDEATRLALAEFRDGQPAGAVHGAAAAGAGAGADHAGSGDRTRAARYLAGPAVHDARVEKAARLHPGRRPDAGARHRRHHGDLLRRRGRAAAAAAVSRRRPDRPRRRHRPCVEREERGTSRSRRAATGTSSTTIAPSRSSGALSCERCRIR